MKFTHIATFLAVVAADHHNIKKNGNKCETDADCCTKCPGEEECCMSVNILKGTHICVYKSLDGQTLTNRIRGAEVKYKCGLNFDFTKFAAIWISASAATFLGVVSLI